MDSRPISLNFDLYFAAYSKSWGGSPAFLRPGTKTSLAYGRAYLITDEQFNDVVLQENGREVDGTRLVPSFEELMKLSRFVVPSNPLYGLLLRIGSQDGWPVITFTTAANDLPVGAPSEAYIKIIAVGLRETYPKMRAAEISKYLLRAEGIRDRIPEKQLLGWVQAVV